jgi:hypothetical protein
MLVAALAIGLTTWVATWLPALRVSRLGQGYLLENAPGLLAWLLDRAAAP